MFRRLIEVFGSVQEAVEAGPQQWRRVKGIGDKTVEDLSAVTDEQVDAEIARADECDVRIVCLADEDYPAALKMIYDPPPVLYIRGSLQPQDATAIGIVGARRCTHYGAEQAERFGTLLGRAGFTVVSGGARGIDTAAHRGALSAGGRTIAVMGCGLSSIYPPENEKLFNEIIDGRGAVISEIPMDFETRAANFHGRNRIISGLSLGVVVVEAALRSGSLITARQAAEQGRVVFAVPGRVDSPLSAGTNQLIRDGSILAADLDDILDNLGQVGEVMAEDEAAPADLSAMPEGVDETETALLEALAGGELGLDELSRRTELPSGAVAASMTMLVLKGLVAQQPGNVFARKR